MRQTPKANMSVHTIGMTRALTVVFPVRRLDMPNAMNSFQDVDAAQPAIRAMALPTKHRRSLIGIYLH